MGHGSCGSWVNCVMGHMGHGSRKMTHFHLCSTEYTAMSIFTRDSIMPSVRLSVTRPMTARRDVTCNVGSYLLPDTRERDP